MTKVLEIKFSGWTATPKMPLILSGNTVCMPTPSYSMLLGVIGCCMGRIISAHEVKIGFHYEYDMIGKDKETRHRLEFDGKKVKPHTKGTDVYDREFHTLPKLTVWIDRLDWMDSLSNPTGCPSLGCSQDILKIDSVEIKNVKHVNSATISGCMLPFSENLNIGGQLVQLAEYFTENEEIGSGRTANNMGVFISVNFDRPCTVNMDKGLFMIEEKEGKHFYLHSFNG